MNFNVRFLFCYELITRCGKAYFTRKDLQNHRKSQHMEKDMPCGKFAAFLVADLLNAIK